nr:protrudin-like [Pocillopora verrucosa]
MEACMEEPMEEERSVEHFDIGTFVLNHRKLCQLVIPLIKWYESLLFVIRWQSWRITFIIMLVTIYLSISYPAYVVHIPLVYASVIFGLSGIRRLGRKTSKVSNLLQRKKVCRKDDDDLNLDVKLAAIKEAHDHLKEYIKISVQIQMVEETLCECLEQFYSIARWEDPSVSKRCFLSLLLSACILFFLPGRYLVTFGLILTFLGNSGFKEVFREAQGKFWLRLQRVKKNILSQNFWIGLVNPWLEIPSKTQTNLEVTENDYDDEWYDAQEQEISLSEDENYEQEDTPLTRRSAKRFSGLSVVTHFSDYRRKKKRVNSVNCASCDVTFSSLLKKRQYCRHCGDSFCSRCCCKRVKRAVFGATAPAAYEETVLVCNSCHGYLMNKEDENKADIW